MSNDDAPDRLAQFRALKLRAKESKKQNRQSLYQENVRLRQDPKETKRLELQKASAEEKLAKLDAEEAGEDFNRKRAWDYTVEEAQDWEARQAQKRINKKNAGFADYTQEASKQYERNIRRLPQAEVNTEQGAEVHDLAFITSKPSEKQIDNLLSSMSATEAARLKVQKKKVVEDDVTYINNRNRVFNEKVSRFYDKYEHTREMRENFERGSAQSCQGK